MNRDLVFFAVATTLTQLAIAQNMSPAISSFSSRVNLTEEQRKNNLSEGDRIREATENVVVIRTHVRDFNPATSWTREKGKGVVIIVVKDNFHPGYEMKFDAEGRLEHIIAYTNQMNHSFSAYSVPSVLTNASAISPLFKHDGIKGNVPERGEQASRATTSVVEGVVYSTSNTFFKAWGIPIGASMIKVPNGEEKSWKIPGDTQNKVYSLSKVENHSMPMISSKPIASITGRKFVLTRELFGGRWLISVHVSVSNQIVAVESHYSSGGFKGTQEEFQKTPLFVLQQQILETLMEQYGKTPEITSLGQGRFVRYAWQKDSACIILTMGQPKSLPNYVYVWGDIEIDYIDQEHVANANKAFENMSSKSDESEEEKAKAKTLL